MKQAMGNLRVMMVLDCKHTRHPPEVALRRLLKRMLREYKIRCMQIKIKAMG